MTTSSNPFELYDRIANQIRNNEGSGACVTCKRAVAILPLRYGVIGSTNPEAASQLAPDLPDNLGQRLRDSNIPLSGARYAVRTLREGYLYLWTQRLEDEWRCEGAYRTYDSGLCKPLAPPDPDAAATYRARLDLGERVIQITDPEDVSEARLLFTPDLLTPRMLEKIRSDSRLRNTLRRLDIRRLLQACTHTEHVIDPERFDSVIAEAIAQTAPELDAVLAEQLFVAPRGYDVLAGSTRRLALSQSHAQGFAVVLDDPIGITQELNAWRNDSATVLSEFMQQKDSEGVDNQRKHTIAFAIDNLKTTLAEQTQQHYIAHNNTVGVRYTDPEYAAHNAHMVSASAGNYRSYRNPADQQRQEQLAIEQAHQHSWDGKYGKYLDEPRRQAFLADYQAVVAHADALKDARAADHLLWLKSPALLDALAHYDRRDSANGLLFEAQLGVAVVGMNATQAGDALLATWSAADSVDLSNLFWRGLAQNQSATQEEVDQLLAQRNRLPALSREALLGLTQGLTDIFDKSHALVTETHFDAPPTVFHLSGAAMLINTFGSRLLQSNKVPLVDAPINYLLALLFKARLGKMGQQFHLESRGGIPLSQGVKAKIDASVAKSFTVGIGPGANAHRLELRLGATLGLLQLWNLKVKFEKAGEGGREKLELGAALVAVTAAVLELGVVAVSRAESNKTQAVQQAGRVMGSGLRLSAGVLAGGVALVGAVLDVQDGLGAWSNNKKSFAHIYFLRAAAQFGSAYFSAAIGLAVAGPFLEYLLKKHASNFILIKLLEPALSASTALSLRMAFMLRWCIRINVSIFVLTVALELLLPNALQQYLEHSTFRKNRDTGTPKTEEQELKNLRKAIEGTF